jgi:hypothetical protein
MCNGFTSISQSKIHIGVEVSPAVKFQTTRNKATGLFTAISGYGFSAGLPVKYNLEDNKTISFGMTYEFTAFDTRINTTLINSFRLSAINVPLVYNHPITENYYVNMGGGVNYIFNSKEYGNGVWINVNPIVNQLQPYLSFGVSLLKNKEDKTYEIGVNARYHVLNLLSLNTSTSTNIVSIDLNLKYFF